MELILVPGDGLVRAASRLTAALSLAHDAILLSKADFGLSAEPEPTVGTVLLGKDLVPDELVPHSSHDALGVCWGHHGNTAWIAARSVADPSATLDEISEALDRLRTHFEELAPPSSSPTGAVAGPQISRAYLDPSLRVPAQTVAAQAFAFTPERMCWERQYTLGIAHFLAHGLDGWLGEFSG